MYRAPPLPANVTSTRGIHAVFPLLTKTRRRRSRSRGGFQSECPHRLQHHYLYRVLLQLSNLWLVQVCFCFWSRDTALTQLQLTSPKDPGGGQSQPKPMIGTGENSRPWNCVDAEMNRRPSGQSREESVCVGDSTSNSTQLHCAGKVDPVATFRRRFVDRPPWWVPACPANHAGRGWGLPTQRTSHLTEAQSLSTLPMSQILSTGFLKPCFAPSTNTNRRVEPIRHFL